MWYIPILEYYSTVQRKETLMHTATWKNPENITPIEPSQAQKDKLSDFTYMAYLEESVSERNQNGGPSACQWRNLGKVGLTV